MNRLPNDFFPQLRFQCVTDNKINRVTQNFLEKMLESNKIEKPAGSVEFHQNVDITRSGGLISCDRSKQSQRTDAELV